MNANLELVQVPDVAVHARHQSVDGSTAIEHLDFAQGKSK
jgi:hypothetical protein